MGTLMIKRIARATRYMKALALGGGLVVAMSMTFVSPAAAAYPSDPPSAAAVPENSILAGGCNNDACIQAVPGDGGVYVRCEYFPVPKRNATGHCHFWGPHYNFNEPDHLMLGWEYGEWHWVNTQGTHCVELWERLGNGSYASRGLPCVAA